MFLYLVIKNKKKYSPRKQSERHIVESRGLAFYVSESKQLATQAVLSAL